MNRSTTDPLPIVYLCGAGRSGSTLLEILLRDRLDVTAGGEIRQIWGAGLRRNARCECGRPFRDCDFWCRSVDHLRDDPAEAKRLEDAGRQLVRLRSVHRLWRGPSAWSSAERAFAASTWHVYERAATIGGAKAVLDSSKTALHAALLIANPAFRVHIIHLVRDSRAVAFSWQRRKEWLASTQSDGEQLFMRRRRPAAVSRIWLTQNVLAATLARRAASYQRVRYEDLSESPDLILEALASQFTELRRQSGAPSVEHHGFMGNPMRFSREASVVRVDETWKAELSMRDASIVTALTAPLLSWFGYPIRRTGRRGTPRRDSNGHS